MKLYQGTAPVILWRDGKPLYEFNDRLLETDDEALIALLLSLGAVEFKEEAAAPQDLTEVVEHISLLSGRVTSLENKGVGDTYSKAEIDRKIADTAVDLSDYVKASDMRPVTEAEVDAITAQ